MKRIYLNLPFFSMTLVMSLLNLLVAILILAFKMADVKLAYLFLALSLFYPIFMFSIIGTLVKVTIDNMGYVQISFVPPLRTPIEFKLEELAEIDFKVTGRNFTTVLVDRDSRIIGVIDRLPLKEARKLALLLGVPLRGELISE